MRRQNRRRQGGNNFDPTLSLPALIDHRFAQNKALPSSITHTRGSNQEYTSAAGVLTIETGTNTAVFHHSPDAANISRGLRIEGGASQLCLQTEVLGTTWTTFNSSVSSNTTVAPDGNTTADTIFGTTDNTNHLILQDVSIDANSTYVFTAWGKADDITELHMFWSNTARTSGIQVTYTLSDGTVETAAATFGSGSGALTARIEDHGGGWYRCSVGGIIDGASTTGRAALNLSKASVITFVGATDEGMVNWGANVVKESFPGSYIAATTGTTSRSANVTSESVAPGSEYTIYVRGFAPLGFIANQYILQLDDGTANETVEVYFDTAGKIVCKITDGGSLLATLTAASATTADTEYRVAIRVKLNDCAMSVDGAAEVTDTGVTIPTTTTGRWGKSDSGDQLNATLARVAIFLTGYPDVTKMSRAGIL